MAAINDENCTNLKIEIPVDTTGDTTYGLDTTIDIKEKNKTNPKVRDGKLLLSLTTRSIRLKKEIYKPGCIEIEFIMKDDDASANYIVPKDYVNVLKEFFFPSYVPAPMPVTAPNPIGVSKAYCTITLTKKVGTTSTEIATNYVVRDVKVRRVNRDVLIPFPTNPKKAKKGVQSVRAVFVKAYSPDYFLTLEKSCCIYRGEKLSEIIRSKTSGAACYKRKANNVEESIFPAYKDLRLCNTTRTQNSNYPLEMLQPYLVQYNESFHDFVVRVANRCGELFYYESGQLLLGLHPSNLSGVTTTTQDVKDRDNKAFPTPKFDTTADVITSQTFSSVIEGEVSIYDSSDIVTTSNVTKSLLSSAGMTATSSCRDENVCMDELLVDLKDGDSIDMKSINEPHWFEIGHEALKADGILSLINNAVTKAAEIPALSSMLVNNGLTSIKEDSKPITLTKDEITAYNKYTTLSTSNAKQNFSNEFYGWIEGIEKTVTAGIQESHREALSADDALLLGQFVSIKNLTTDTATFYISSVDLNLSTAIVVEGESKEPQTKYNVDLNVKYCPLQYETGRSPEFTYQKKVFPPLADISHIRKAEPQQATIVSAADPLRNGRVQIRYPWQTAADGDKSPWISVTTPFTGEKDSGMLFAPDAGDYVMINYEGGNIERPYVDGSLFHSAKGATNWGDVPIFGPKLDFRKGHSAITKNGSGITFVDGVARNFVGSLFPSFIQGILTGIDKAQDDKRLGGGLILSDYYGMYSISMSSLSRSISIDCPWGKVDINAFTGINLSAPNGDIKISGKNVTIEAGNKVSITSGTNIKGKEYAADLAKVGGQLLGGLAGSVVKSCSLTGLGFDVTKMLDVSFTRSVYEIIMRPVDGSLTLTSGRNLMMQAGKGKVTPPASTLSTVSSPSKIVNVNPLEMIKQVFKNMYSSKDMGSQQANAAANTKSMVGALIIADYAIIDFAFSRMGEAIKTIRSKKTALENLIFNTDDRTKIKGEWNSWSNFVGKVYNNGIQQLPAIGELQANGQTLPVKTYKSMKSAFEELKKIAKHTDIPAYCKKKFKDDKFYAHMHKASMHGIGANATIDALQTLFDVPENKKATIFGDVENTAQNIVALVNDENLNWEEKIAKAKKLYKRALFYNIVKASSHITIGANDEEKNAQLDVITIANVLNENKDALRQHGWGDLKAAITGVDTNKDNTFKAENPTGSTFGGALLSSIGLGDVASYDENSQEWTFFGNTGKLFNVNGQAGPRTIWDGTQSKGTILVSAGENTFQLGKKPKVEQVTSVDNDDLVSGNKILSLL